MFLCLPVLCRASQRHLSCGLLLKNYMILASYQSIHLKGIERELLIEGLAIEASFYHTDLVVR